MSPTQRTIRELKNMGRRCAIVEKWNPFARRAGTEFKGIKQDLFGIIDIIALDPERGVVGVQACGSSFKQHLDKILRDEEQSAQEWLSTPGAVFELWGWRKVKKNRGGKQMVWKARVVEIRECDLESFRGGTVTKTSISKEKGEAKKWDSKKEGKVSKGKKKKSLRVRRRRPK